MQYGIVSKQRFNPEQIAEKRLYNALVIYLVGFFLNEVLTIDLGLLFLRPEKIALLVGCYLVFPYASVPFNVAGKSSLLLRTWVYYNLWMGISVFWNPEYGSILNQLNIFLKHGGEALLTCGFVGAIMRAGGLNTLRRVLPLFVLFAFTEIITGSLDYLLGQRVVPSGTRDADYTYGIGIFGFHAERLIFAEIMVIGTAISLGRLTSGGGSFLLRWIVLVLAPLFLLLLSSYTGILAYLLLLSIYLMKLANWKGRLSIVIIMVLGVAVFPNLYGTLTPDWFREATAKKLESRMEGSETSEWRFLTSAYLLERVWENPSLVGQGYFASKDEIGSLFDKANTSHTLASIPYEQGAIGVALLGWLLFLFLWHLYDFLRSDDTHDHMPKDIRLFVVAVALCALMRFLFYYQVSNVYLYLLAVTFLSSAKICYRKNAATVQRPFTAVQLTGD